MPATELDSAKDIRNSALRMLAEIWQRFPEACSYSHAWGPLADVAEPLIPRTSIEVSSVHGSLVGTCRCVGICASIAAQAEQLLRTDSALEEEFIGFVKAEVWFSACCDTRPAFHVVSLWLCTEHMSSVFHAQIDDDDIYMTIGTCQLRHHASSVCIFVPVFTQHGSS